jgi:FKBP-type peptidyl-prolyl cis-trans isomerase (trigger factor)
LKDISEIHRRQKENHRQKKEIKIQKKLREAYNSDSVTLTSRSLSEIAESQIEEDFQSFELDSEEQFKRNNTSCQKLREQNEHAHESIFFRNSRSRS